jgi:hypothetical protein
MAKRPKQRNSKSKKRTRPVKFNLDKTKHAQLRHRWRSWLSPLSLELNNLKWKQDIFWKLQDISKQNNELLKPGDFFNWMCDNYSIAVPVSVRRFDDQDKRSRSLWRILYEILENPGIISRQAHLRLYGKDQKSLGNTTFDYLVGPGQELLSQRQVRSDLKKLEDDAGRIRLLVNKRIAHFTKPGDIRKLPKYEDLDKALDTIVKVLSKYTLLLTGKNISVSFEDEERSTHWMKVLIKPWLNPESRFYNRFKGIVKK